MKRITIMVLVVLAQLTYSQDITNKLGGNTANETYDITDSSDNVLFQVRGDGRSGMGGVGVHSSALLYIHNQSLGDQFSLVVIGEANNMSTVRAHASGENSTGVYGTSGSSTGTGVGVYGYSNAASGNGIRGLASKGDGIYGQSDGNGAGVSGYSQGGHGIYGKTELDQSDIYGGYFVGGVYGWSLNQKGLRGVSQNGDGIYGQADGSGAGISGFSQSGYGVYGNSSVSDFWAQNGTYGGPSSIRWKQDIKEIENPIEKLMKIRGVYFKWDEEHGGGNAIGCIAEEVGEVLPEVVIYEDNGIDALGMDYSKLSPLLIEAIKTQQLIIEDLHKRITQLENN